MRLVVSYSHGDGYTYSCDENLPFEYESAEALLVDITDAANLLIERKKAMAEAWDAHSKKFGFTPHAGKEAEYWESYTKLTEAFPQKSFSPTIVAGETTLFIEHFIDDGKFFEPTIYTVDEWFKVNGL